MPLVGLDLPVGFPLVNVYLRGSAPLPGVVTWPRCAGYVTDLYCCCRYGGTTVPVYARPHLQVTFV